MIDREGCAEADAALVVFGIDAAAFGIGFAVRERRIAAAAFCQGVNTQIALAGARTTEPAPELYLPARMPLEVSFPLGLIEYEPSAHR